MQVVAAATNKLLTPIPNPPLNAAHTGSDELGMVTATLVHCSTPQMRRFLLSYVNTTLLKEQAYIITTQ